MNRRRIHKCSWLKRWENIAALCWIVLRELCSWRLNYTSIDKRVETPQSRPGSEQIIVGIKTRNPWARVRIDPRNASDSNLIVPGPLYVYLVMHPLTASEYFWLLTDIVAVNGTPRVSALSYLLTRGSIGRAWIGWDWRSGAITFSLSRWLRFWGGKSWMGGRKV